MMGALQSGVRPYSRMILLIVLRNWDRALTVEEIAVRLENMGFHGLNLTPERIEIELEEFKRRIWDIALMPEEA
jgi:hypothetical protein